MFVTNHCLLASAESPLSACQIRSPGCSLTANTRIGMQNPVTRLKGTSKVSSVKVIHLTSEQGEVVVTPTITQSLA